MKFLSPQVDRPRRKQNNSHLASNEVEKMNMAPKNNQKSYGYNDREMVLSESKEHVKVKSVTVGDESEDED